MGWDEKKFPEIKVFPFFIKPPDPKFLVNWSETERDISYNPWDLYGSSWMGGDQKKFPGM